MINISGSSRMAFTPVDVEIVERLLQDATNPIVVNDVVAKDATYVFLNSSSPKLKNSWQSIMFAL